MPEPSPYGETPAWRPERPHLGLGRLVYAWLSATVALLVGVWIIPGAHVNNF